jgi:hypothetical protein
VNHPRPLGIGFASDCFTRLDFSDRNVSLSLPINGAPFDIPTSFMILGKMLPSYYGKYTTIQMSYGWQGLGGVTALIDFYSIPENPVNWHNLC